MCHEKQHAKTGRIETMDLGGTVKISLRGMFYGRGFTFEKDSVTGIDEEVSLESVLFYEDTSAKLRATYAGTENKYIATVELSDLLDIDGNPSRHDFLNIKHESKRDSWPDSKTKALWPMD